jgi:hypothetical protein
MKSGAFFPQAMAPVQKKLIFTLPDRYGMTVLFLHRDMLAIYFVI